ncbi:hypothetical protein D3C77_616180 [compost metagenome]
MMRPHDCAMILHFIGRCPSDLVGARHHPRYDSDAIRKNDDAFRTHFPQRLRKLILIQIMNKGHSNDVRRMIVNDYPMVRIDLQTFDMAHKVGWQLACRHCIILQSP